MRRKKCTLAGMTVIIRIDIKRKSEGVFELTSLGIRKTSGNDYFHDEAIRVQVEMTAIHVSPSPGLNTIACIVVATFADATSVPYSSSYILPSAYLDLETSRRNDIIAKDGVLRARSNWLDVIVQRDVRNQKLQQVSCKPATGAKINYRCQPK